MPTSNSKLKWKQRNTQRIKEYVTDYLKKHPCVDCNESNIALLQFDHRDPKTKKFNVRDYSRSIQTTIEEIAKCDVRCLPCHAKRTQKERHHAVRRKPPKRKTQFQRWVSRGYFNEDEDLDDD